MNNSVYYFYFDTVVNQYLIDQDALDIHHGETIGLVVSTQCDYFAPIAFPDSIEGALAVEHVGRSSVRYRLGIFKSGEDKAVASGIFTHVYVDRFTRRPVALPNGLLQALDNICL